MDFLKKNWIWFLLIAIVFGTWYWAKNITVSVTKGSDVPKAQPPISAGNEPSPDVIRTVISDGDEVSVNQPDPLMSDGLVSSDDAGSLNFDMA